MRLMLSAWQRDFEAEVLGALTGDDAWEACARHSWFGLAVSRRLGGLGLGVTETVAFAFAGGRAVQEVRLHQHLLATQLLAERAQDQPLLCQALSGSVALRIALPSEETTGAVHVVVAETGVSRERRLDLRAPDDCRPDWLVWSSAALAHSAYLMGLATTALSKAVLCIDTHHQFARRLADYQALGFRLSEARVRGGGLRDRLFELAMALELGTSVPDEVTRFTRLADEYTRAAVEHAVHVHGARGLLAHTIVSRCRQRLVSTFPAEVLATHEDEDHARPGCADPGLPEEESLRRLARRCLERRVPPEWTHLPDGERPIGTVHKLFEEAAARHPKRTAVLCAEGSITYEDLDLRSARLARQLRLRGAGPGQVVALFLQRSIDMVVAVLAVLKSGAAFVPLDPEYPAERLDLMARRSGARLVISPEWLDEWLPETLTAIVRPDADESLALSGQESAPVSEEDERDLAYLLFTSGSTGEPKAVECEHRGLVNRLRWDREQFPLDAHDTVLQQTSLNFDAALLEIFIPLISGARILLADPGGTVDIGALTRLLDDQQVTVLNGVPSFLDALAEEAAATGAGSSLRYVFAGGETLSQSCARRLLDTFPAAQLYNFYGPVEAGIDATSWHCTAESLSDPVPIGHPLPHVRVVLLDEQGLPVPVGTKGQICIGGIAVARGYRGDPERTAESFLPDPFADPADTGERLYRTGDMARYRPDGALEFLGRQDTQVKVRGVRIELEEIEAILHQHPDVRQAAMVATDSGSLQAHVVLHDGRSPATLRTFAADRLPSHMVPAAVHCHDALPSLPNGKVDRKRLASSTAVMAPPKDGSEQELALVDQVTALMRRIISSDDLHPTANFFDAGGTSLQAARFLTRVRTHLAIDVSLSQFLQAPTAAAVTDRARGTHT